MTWCTRPVALGILAVMMALTPVSAEPRFGLGRLEGDAGVGFELGRQRTRVDGAVESESLRTRSDERLHLRNTGAWILAPGVATASFGATFGLLQEDAAIDDQDFSRRGRLLGYSFETVLLSDMPYTLTLFTNRNETVASREFGGVSDTAFTNRGGSVRLGEDSVLPDLGVRHVTSTLGARQEWTEETTTVLGQSFRRDEERMVLTYEGNKGFETADLGLRYELTALEDRVNPLGNFRAHAGTLSYSLDFGPTLNRRWDSHVRYAARTGASPNTFVSVDEALRLDHAENLFTDYRYLFSRSETPAGATNTHVGTVKAQHRLYESLTTGLTGQGTLRELDGGTRASYAGQIDLDYQRKLGGYGRLLAGTGLRYQMDEQQLRRGRIDVLDEAHTAPARLGGDAGFTLANRFVIGASIVVVDTRSGARLPAVAGVDYVVRQDGDFTKIIPLVGSAVILSGDPLAVSYSFELDPSATFSTTAWRTTAGLDFGWVALSLAHEESDQALVSGRDGNFLDDRRTETVRVDLRGEWEKVRALGRASYEIHESTRLEFDAWRFGQSLSVGPFLDVVLGLDAEAAFTTFTLPRRRSTTYSARASLDWTPAAGLLLTGFLGVSTLHDSVLAPETVREGGVRAVWRFGKLEVAPTFTWIERQRGAIDGSDLRFLLHVDRRF